MMEVSDVSDEGFLAYADLVKEQLAAEESRTASMEARAISVLTTSGGLVSLLLALAALVSTRKDFRMPVAGRAVLLVAVALFLLAALAAISVFSPGPRNLVDPAAMGDEIRRRWNDPVKVA